ncbi:Self-incompatibility protein S1 [Linum perenne]
MRNVVMMLLVSGAISIVVFMACPSIGAQVHVTNKLTSNRTLIAHCGSKNDDIRAIAITVGSSIDWSFEPNLSTLFWCNLAVEDKRLSFTAFQFNDRGGYNDNSEWLVMDDGVYGKPRNGFKFFIIRSWSS